MMKQNNITVSHRSSGNFALLSGNTYEFRKPSRYTVSMNKRWNTGFTLVEAMVTLVIAAIVVMMSTNLSGVFQNNQTSAYVQDIVAALQLAKSEAITRNSRVTVCVRKIPTTPSDPPQCAPSGTGKWEDGWYVFVNANAIDNSIVSPGVNLLRMHDPLKGGYTLTGNTQVDDYISFIPTGFPRTLTGTMQKGTLLLCDRRGYGQHARKIVLNTAGRIRSGSATDSDFSALGDTACP
jgi:type IV fimbrial biogenesis protein FimT